MNYLFVPEVFGKVVAATVVLVVVGLGVATISGGRPATIDIVGVLMCVPVFAYLVHLWITPSRSD